MDEEHQRARQLLRAKKPELIVILSGDADLVLQHAYSLQLLTDDGYNKVKPQLVARDKVTTLLDLVYNRGPEAAHGLLELLKGDVFQETFPGLSFLKNPDMDQHLPTGRAVHMY